MPKRLFTNSVDRRRFLQTTAAAGGTLALATALPHYARAQVPTFRLGQIAPFTGSAAEFGEFYRDAVGLDQLARRFDRRGGQRVGVLGDVPLDHGGTEHLLGGGACNYDEAGDVITPQAIWKFTETGIETVKVIPADEIPSE